MKSKYAKLFSETVLGKSGFFGAVGAMAVK